MKTKLLVFFILLIACLPKGIQANNSIQQYHAKQDTASMKKYQTFDEFTMRGIGTAKASPFVYVKEMGDSIYVVSSCPKDSARLYVKINNDLWYNHMEYHMWKKDSVAYKSLEWRIAKTYDRYIYNDTITEICTGYIEGKEYPNVIVRTQKKLFEIHIDSLKHSDAQTLRNIVYKLSNSNNKNVFKSELKESDNMYMYSYVDSKMNKYEYEKKAYGVWGILPGVDETFLYFGIDIREYSDHLKDFQKKNPDYIYEYSDELPTFPNGTMAFRKFLKKRIASSLYTKDEDNDWVVIRVVIEKDGSITNPILVKGIDQAHNENAMNIIHQMPKWIPAQLNGSPIRYSKRIQISYDKSYYDRVYR